MCRGGIFQDRVSLCSPGCPGTHFVDQTDLELRNPPASASQVLGLKAFSTTTRLGLLLRDLQYTKLRTRLVVEGLIEVE